MRFEKRPFPQPAKGEIERQGGKPISAWFGFKNGHSVAVLFSEEPSKDDGGMEHHVSISSATYGHRRMPTDREVKSALEVVGMDVTDSFFRGTLFHAYGAPVQAR